MTLQIHMVYGDSGLSHWPSKEPGILAHLQLPGSRDQSVAASGTHSSPALCWLRHTPAAPAPCPNTGLQTIIPAAHYKLHSQPNSRQPLAHLTPLQSGVLKAGVWAQAQAPNSIRAEGQGKNPGEETLVSHILCTHQAGCSASSPSVWCL